MRRILTATIFAIVTVGAAPAAMAQSSPPTDKFWFSISGGAQVSDNGFSDAFDVPLYAENEHVSVTYPVKGGVVIAASGGYRVWKQLAIGLGVTRYNRRSTAAIDAQLPHPFFDNQFRPVQGTAETTRNEVGAHVLIGWIVPLGDRMRLLLTAGPSWLSVGHTLVTDVQFSETYPYDTALFTGATTKNTTATAPGFNAGADLFWMFSRNVGVGGLVQITRASVKENTGGRTISVDAGGAQAGAGLRFVF